jgi:hypothetical protein
MVWVSIAAIALIVMGLILPMFGPIFDRNFGLESFVFIAVGLVVLVIGVIWRRGSADGSSVGGSYGDATGATNDHAGHDGHEGGHNGDAGH